MEQKLSKLFAILTFSLCSSILLMSAVSYAASKKTYKIGAIFDISGKSSALGIPEKQTAEMVVGGD